MAIEQSDTAVLQARDGRVVLLTLNRPARLNAITDGMLDSLTAALHEARDDDSVRAVIITGAGRGFCSGADLRDPLERGGIDVRRELSEHYAPAIRAMRELPKPVIAAVNGPAAGAGFALALAADLRIAARSASFAMTFVRIGFIPDAGSTYFLPRLVGLARAAEMMMLGDTVDAMSAHEVGLVSSVVPDAELLPAAHALAARLAAGPLSVAFIKEALRLTAENSLTEQLAVEERLQEQAVASADFSEGLSAFLQKRAPEFTGH